jgi:murein L,D-transpeptidase YafK
MPMGKTGTALLVLVMACALLVGAGIARSSEPLPPGATADRILVIKAERALILFRDGKPLKRYSVALGHAPVGAKRRQGDSRTPEGLYRIDSRNPLSGYHLSLHISYPDASDRARARRAGVSPGGAIMIHGIRNGFGWLGPRHRLVDWTDGCIAVTDEEIEEIWRAVPIGTPIEIRP